MKLSTAVVQYLERKRVSTVYAGNAYRIWLQRLLEKIEDKELDIISQEEVTSFMVWVKDNWKPKTLEYCSAVIHNFASDYNLKWKVKVRRQRAESYSPVTNDTHQKILALLPVNEFVTLQKHLIVRILHETGCRISELLSLDVEDIFDEPWATIETRKTILERRIFWSEETHDLIVEKYLPIRSEIKRSSALFIGLYNSGDYSDRLTPRAVQRWYEYFSEVLGIKVVPHGERHNKAHDILDKGGSLADIQNLLGHTNPISSHKYTGYGGREAELRAKKFL